MKNLDEKDDFSPQVSEIPALIGKSMNLLSLSISMSQNVLSWLKIDSQLGV